MDEQSYPIKAVAPVRHGGGGITIVAAVVAAIAGAVVDHFLDDKSPVAIVIDQLREKQPGNDDSKTQIDDLKNQVEEAERQTKEWKESAHTAESRSQQLKVDLLNCQQDNGRLQSELQVKIARLDEAERKLAENRPSPPIGADRSGNSNSVEKVETPQMRIRKNGDDWQMTLESSRREGNEIRLELLVQNLGQSENEFQVSEHRQQDDVYLQSDTAHKWKLVASENVVRTLRNRSETTYAAAETKRVVLTFAPVSNATGTTFTLYAKFETRISTSSATLALHYSHQVTFQDIRPTIKN